MHYYKRHIGDYSKKAGRLTMLQHGSYTLLLDACYDREKFPTLGDAIDWCWASNQEEIDAVKFVLSKFFTLDGDVYVQNRIQEEINSYHGNAATNKRIAIDRETKRRENNTNRAENSTNREQSVNEPPPNHKPLTTNHKPITKNQEPKYKPPIGDKLLADWLEVRKAKRAGKLTETAFNGLAREAALASITPEQAVQVCCERSWQSFKAEWYLKAPARGNGGVQDARLETARQIMGVKNGTYRQTRNITPGRTIESDSQDIPKTLNVIR